MQAGSGSASTSESSNEVGDICGMSNSLTIRGTISAVCSILNILPRPFASVHALAGDRPNLFNIEQFLRLAVR